MYSALVFPSFITRLTCAMGIKVGRIEYLEEYLEAARGYERAYSEVGSLVLTSGLY